VFCINIFYLVNFLLRRTSKKFELIENVIDMLCVCLNLFSFKSLNKKMINVPLNIYFFIGNYFYNMILMSFNNTFLLQCRIFCPVNLYHHYALGFFSFIFFSVWSLRLFSLFTLFTLIPLCWMFKFIATVVYSGLRGNATTRYNTRHSIL